jgi:hypothetical protein
MIGGAILAKNLERLPSASLEACAVLVGWSDRVSLGTYRSGAGPGNRPEPSETASWIQLSLLRLDGDFMNDALSTPTPALHDGMAVIQELDRNHLMLVRDHEENHPGPVAFGAGSLAYDPSLVAARPISSLIWRWVGSSRRSRASAAPSATALGA